jgi:MFS family permease
MGIPFAWLADRGSRRNLIVASMTFWSVMTAACGLAQSFLTLFLARIGVGVGEAGLSPAAYSMIADSFPAERRARPVGVYAAGAILGVGLALIIGGGVVHWATSAPPVSLPRVGVLETWQVALLVVSIPGPLLALLLLFVREPQRHESKAAREDRAPFRGFLRERGRVFVLISLGYSLIGVAIAAYLAWTPALMIRSHGWPVARVGTVYGAVLLIFSTAGVLAGGWLVDRLTARGIQDAVLRVSIGACTAALPFAIAAPLMPTGEGAIATIAIMSLLFGLAQGLPPAALQAIAANRIRARVIAVYLLIGNIIAFTIGPTGVALISDYLLGGPARIGVAIAILSSIVAPLGVLSLWFARRPFVRAAADEAARSP